MAFPVDPEVRAKCKETVSHCLNPNYSGPSAAEIRFWPPRLVDTELVGHIFSYMVWPLSMCSVFKAESFVVKTEHRWSEKMPPLLFLEVGEVLLDSRGKDCSSWEREARRVAPQILRMFQLPRARGRVPREILSNPIV